MTPASVRTPGRVAIPTTDAARRAATRPRSGARTPRLRRSPRRTIMPSPESSAASIADKSILDILSLDKAVNHVAKSLREHAEAEVWGTQEAVSKWLALLADDLDDCAKELKRRGIK